MEIKSLEQSLSDIGRIFFLYGKPGSGKTTLAASLDTPMLIIDTGEHGTGVLAGRTDIDVLKIAKIEEADMASIKIAEGATEYSKYKTIVVDSLHSLRDIYLATFPADVEPDWNRVTQFIIKFSSRIMSRTVAGVNIVLISHESIKEDPKSALKRQIIPSLGDRTAQAVVGRCDAVIYCALEERKEFSQKSNKVEKSHVHVAYCRPEASLYTRFRVPKERAELVPDKITTGDLHEAIDLLNGAVAKATRSKSHKRTTRSASAKPTKQPRAAK